MLVPMGKLLCSSSIMHLPVKSQYAPSVQSRQLIPFLQHQQAEWAQYMVTLTSSAKYTSRQ